MLSMYLKQLQFSLNRSLSVCVCVCVCVCVYVCLCVCVYVCVCVCSFRVFCYKLVCSKAFNVITYVTIFLGSVLLTLEIPLTSSLSRGSLLCLIQVHTSIHAYILIITFWSMATSYVCSYCSFYVHSCI